ncbi:MAG: anti-sigma factor antagonist [Planctomycetia bacterium]|nr:anti-sigma factor antagonist [Planctomycetia bacterium]
MPDDDDFVLGEPDPADETVSDDESGILKDANADPNLLTFVRDGERAIVGFNSKTVPDELCIAAYRSQLLKYVQDFGCKVLAFELAGVKILPSGMLGLLVTLKKRGTEVELLNPVPDIVEVLRITRLAPMFTIRPAAK